MRARRSSSKAAGPTARARRPSAARAGTARERITPKGWIVIVGGVATGAVILTSWLPVGALLNQRAQLSAANTRLTELAAEGRLLSAESARLATPEEAARLAREQYQLVAPGQRLIQVLTPSGAPSSKSTGGPFPGDPGLSAPVTPGATAVVPTAPGQRVTATPRTETTAPTGGFFSRVTAALEFWR